MKIFFTVLFLNSYFLNALCQTTIDQVNVLTTQKATHKCYIEGTNSDSTNSDSDDRFIKFQISSTGSTGSYTDLARYQVQKGDIKYSEGYSRYSSGGKLVFGNGMVTISNALPEDEAYYKCLTEGFYIEEKDKMEYDFKIQVFIKPKVTIVKTADPLNAVDSESPSITAAICTAAEGRPDTSVVEWKTDTPLAFAQTNSSKAVDSVYTLESELLITPNQYYNTRPFTCRVTHPAFAMGGDSLGLDYVEETITLNVTYPPNVPTITAKDGVLSCTSGGNPEPKYKWQMPPASSEPVVYAQSVPMIMPDDPQRANDTYTCVAYNGYPPDATAHISTYEANVKVTEINSANIGLIVGCIFGGLLILGLIIGLVYWFVIRKTDDGSGPYNKGKIYNPTQMQRYGGDSSGARPTIEHANESINHNRPPSPKNPPPPEERDSSSESDDHTEGDDVELAPRPSSRGITSKASINFQPYWRTSLCEKDRKRPSTSPRAKARPQYDQPPGYTDPRYEVPPGEIEDDRAHLTHDQTPYDEEPDAHLYDLPQDRYPEYYQDNGYDQEYDDEDKPITYASLDDRYLGDPNHRRPSDEHVEYAHIRPAYVV